METIKNGIYSNYGYNEEDVEQVKISINKIKKDGYFKGCNNLNIYYQVFSVINEKGRIVISHGFSECIEKYNELIYYFTEMGYSVYAIEHRGHGRSGSFGKKHKSQISIDKFEYYVEDLRIFLDTIVVGKDVDLYLYAHSMGGAIGTMFLEKYCGYFKKAILSAPMMDINTGEYHKAISYLISQIYINIGKGKEFLFGQGPFEGKYDLESSGTSNMYRYKNHLDYLNKDEELQRCGGSFKWLNESLKATKEILKKRNIEKINIPILFFQAGRDTFVKEKGQNKFCEIANMCKKIRFENGKHELYMEDDEIMIEYLKNISEFLK